DGQVGHPAHPVPVVVPPRQQARPSRRAQRRRPEVGQPHPVGRQPVDHRGGDVRAVTPQLGLPDVVEDHQHHVWCPGRRGRVLGPPRLRLPPVPPDPPHGCQHARGTDHRATRLPWTRAPMEPLADRYVQVRSLTEALAAPLSAEDQTVQSMPDVSPTKWHRGHTSWFFETFILEPRGHPAHHPGYGYIFNSYYEAVGA